MKKILGLLFITLLWVGCSDDDDDVWVYAVDWGNNIEFTVGESLEFNVTQEGNPKLEITQPTGWTVTSSGGKLTVKAPEAETVGAEFSGEVKIIAGEGVNAITEQTAVYTVATLTFEDVPASYLAGPTSAGENIHEYSGYHDVVTDLKWESTSTTYDEGVTYWWSHGIAVSQWTDMITPGFTNQCSAYATGGNNDSKTFGVNFSGEPIAFAGAETECVVEEVWVMNNTYAALSMKNGDDFGAKVFNYEDKDWLKLTVTGYDKKNNATGTVDFYLADFQTTTSPGIITEWSKVELATLGKVHKLGFSLESSDAGEWGMNTPNYFCIDDIKVRK